MIDLELLHTSLIKLQRLRISIGVCALVVAVLGGYVISERSNAYRALIAVLQQQHTAVAKKQRQRAQNIDAAKHALQQQGIVQMQQQRVIQVLRAIGHTATTTSTIPRQRLKVIVGGYTEEQAISRRFFS